MMQRILKGDTSDKITIALADGFDYAGCVVEFRYQGAVRNFRNCKAGQTIELNFTAEETSVMALGAFPVEVRLCTADGEFYTVTNAGVKIEVTDCVADVRPGGVIIVDAKSGLYGVDDLPSRYTTADIRAKINEIIERLGGGVAALCLAACVACGSLFGAGVTVQKANLEDIHNDEKVVTGVTFDATDLATKADLERAVERKDGAARPLPKYLHALDFADSYANDAAWYYALADIGGACSSVRDGNAYSRNFDFPYDERAEFVVLMAAGPDRFASVGVSNVGTNLTEAIVTSGKPSRFYKCLPGATVDGINECGVAANINVVPANGAERTVWAGHEINAVGGVRWVLDHATSAGMSASNLAAKVYIPDALIRKGYSAHFMVADERETWIVEDGVARKVDGRAVLTNFRLYAQDDPFGTGYERHALLASGGNITSAWFRAAYRRPFTRPTEFAAPGVGTHTETNALVAWANANVPQGAPESLTRNGKSWQTVHCSVYDLSNRVLRVAAQETDDWYVFAVAKAGTDEEKVAEIAKSVIEPLEKNFDQKLENTYVMFASGAVVPTNNVSGNYAVAIGNQSTVNGPNGGNNQGIAIGRQAYVGIKTNANGQVIGSLVGDAAIAIGSKAKAYGKRGVSIGYRTENYGISAVAIGSAEPTQPDGDPWHLTIASNDYTVAIGHNAQALAKGAAQMGWGTNTTANTLKFQGTTIVDANGKIAYVETDPQFNNWTNLYSLPLGPKAKTYGCNNTVAIGNAAETFNADAFAFGSEARVKVMDGTNVAASAGGAVQLGNGINSERTSLQFRGTKIVNGQGKIPTASLEAASAIGQIGNKADKSDLNDYLKLSGGTMTGNINANGIVAKSIDTDWNTLRIGNVKASGSDSVVVGRNGSYTTNTVAGIVIGPNTIVSAEQGIAIGGRCNEGVVGTGKVCRVTASGAVQIGVGENGEANSLKFGNAAGTRNTTIVNGQGVIPTDSLELKTEFASVKNLARTALQTETDPTVGMTNNIIYIKGQHIAPITSHQSLANYYTKGQTDAKIVELAPAPGNYYNVSNNAMNAYQKVAGKVVLCPTTGGTTGADSISISVGNPGATHTAAVAIGAQAFASGPQSIAIGGRNDGDAKKCYATATGAVQIGSGRNNETDSLKFGNSSGTVNTTIVSSHGKIPMASVDIEDTPGNLRYTITSSNGRFYFTPTEAINPRD